MVTTIVLVTLAITGWSLFLYTVIGRNHFLHVAYQQGKRNALKEAIETAKERSDVAAYCAPKSQLTVGMIRSQAGNQIEMDLRALLSRIR